MDDTQDPFWTWADLLLFLVVGIPVFLVCFWVARSALSPFTRNPAVLLMIPQFTGQAAMLVPLALMFRAKYERSLFKSLRLGVRGSEAIKSFSMGYVLAISVLLVATALRTPQIQSPMQDLMNDPRSAVWVGVFAVSLGPAFEEILFRGLLQPVAARSVGVIGGILIAALPFALLHGPQYAWSWRHVLMIALAGAGFGWWRWRTNSTGASMLMHAAYNSVLVVGYLIGRTAL
jgi:membrane protease YdiL (CAAX protease family)